MGYNVNKQNPGPGGTHGTDGFDVFLGAECHGLTVDYACDLDPVHQCNHQGNDPEAGFKDSCQSDGQ